MVKKAGISPGIITGLVIAIVTFAVIILVETENEGSGIFLVLLPIAWSSVFIQELFKKTAVPFTNIAYTYLGVIFAVIPFIFFHSLAYGRGLFNFHIPLAFLLMLWANDTGAYLVGSRFGKTKLFERHSPKKTLEGFVGGVIITGVVAYIISIYFTDVNLQQWICVGVLISVFGTAGDLVESMFKRSINVKDSGDILPGHGGLLDRFDGFLMAAPIVYAYLYFITNA